MWKADLDHLVVRDPRRPARANHAVEPREQPGAVRGVLAVDGNGIGRGSALHDSEGPVHLLVEAAAHGRLEGAHRKAELGDLSRFTMRVTPRLSR